LRDAPEIVKILYEEERLGKLSLTPQSSYYKPTTTEILIEKKYNKNTKTEYCINKSNLADEKFEDYKKEIEEKIKKLKKLDKIKSNFLNITSHELRTPISAIKGYIQMILKNKLGEINEEQKKGLEIVLRNTNRLDHLIQDILDISRLDSGKMRFVPEKTNIKTMIEETVETMQTIADEKHIKIKSMVEENVPDLIIDVERIKQVIINLLSNAIKFSPYGSVINVKVYRKKNQILFEVQDFGRGIPKNQKYNIFKAFYQIRSYEDKKLGGVGLGLAISRGIIIAYGGQISVESSLGNGSKFTFSLPLKTV
jgi:signal transduction histidine kinase